MNELIAVLNGFCCPEEIPTALLRLLKSGRDQFSRIRLPKLTELKPESAIWISKMCDNDTDRASALRWVCRGCNIQTATKKVEYDRMVEDQFRKQYERAKMEEQVLADIIGW